MTNMFVAVLFSTNWFIAEWFSINMFVAVLFSTDWFVQNGPGLTCL